METPEAALRREADLDHNYYFEHGNLRGHNFRNGFEPSQNGAESDGEKTSTN
jgi:hypothetical protein